MKGWEKANLFVIYQTYKTHKRLKQKLQQYQAIDGCRNIWISKPSYNARGVGIFCFNQLKEAFNGNSHKRQSCPKIVQKYIETPNLMHNRKYDIRQWVFVSSFDPLEVFIYKRAYLRICSKDFDLA
jgi:glutathionylspermidine synthase